MGVFDGPIRDIAELRPPRWGRVREVDDVVPWQLVDQAGRPVEPVYRYLRDLVAQGKSLGTVRTYAYVLQRWWRFLIAVGVAWDRATSAEVRDYVLWLRHTAKPGATLRKASAATAGTVNPITRKRYPGDEYQTSTIVHSNAVVHGFYEFWIERGAGPVVNPVPHERARGGRPQAHHNPMEPYRAQGRMRYNPRKPKRRPRAIPDALWVQLFGAMRSNRDRAILALDVSTGARAAELLGMRGADIDWGGQLICVRRKGTKASQWLPASPDAFVWLRLYLAELGELGPDDPVWQTLRQRRRGAGELERQPLSYDAWRAVLRRANAALGTNWSTHDMRHTCAIRMVRDQRLSLRDVQVILGHGHLTSTEVYLVEDDQEVIDRVLDHLADREQQPAKRSAATAPGYDAGDLAVLFGAG
ncbi:site-specific integrase [Paractinoplanes ferrugineus]|uniref:Integrase n=1 Tax=Paractinoplanes ferrugineus TaxID=113564 RepID=A0A919J3K6_9ACTN|nr:tyrosine-type recombinase/integrase [Actinoplanes ferrugineus]GIE14156.1 integrase [Actinoplanes ferrugineus]